MCVLKEEGETYQIGNKWTQQIFFMKGNFYMNTSTSFCKQNAESIRLTSPDQSEAEPGLHWPMRGWAGQEPWLRVINLQLLSSYHLTPQGRWLTGLMPLNMTEQPWTTRQTVLSCINEMKYAQALEWALEWDSILNLSLRNNHFYTNGLRDK